MRIARLALVVLTLALTAATAPAATSSPWPLPPSGYAFEPIPGCPALGARQKHYRVCEDQMAVFADALARARAGNRLLIVHFGATWCPLCIVLEGRLSDSAKAGSGGSLLPAGADAVSIAVSTVVAGRRADVASGQAVLNLVQAHAKGPALRAVPYFAVVDPADVGRAFTRNLDDLERSGSFDFAAYRTMAADAVRHVRDGAPPPNEPSAMWRRLMRWYHKIAGWM